MSELTVVDRALDLREFEGVLQVRQNYPVYIPVGGLGPAWFKAPKPVGLPSSPRLRFAPGLGGRADAARYARKLASHAAANEAPRPSTSVPAYLRATYAAAGQPLIEDVDRILDSSGLADLAHDLFDVEYIVPHTVYANVYLPGQQLHPHTDVPAFRGAERSHVPSWLLVAMHHSGLFERWRIPIATVVMYPTSCQGGEFTYYSATAPGTLVTRTIAPADNAAVVFDADTIFHRVDKVGGETTGLGDISRVYLAPRPDHWQLHRDGSTVEHLATYRTEEIRYSVSWKAYCFPDLASWRSWVDHTDDLSLGGIIPKLSELLCERGVLDGPDHGLDEAQLAAAIIDEVIPFPPPGT